MNLDLIEMDLGFAYVLFSLACAIGALWMMQRTTADAGLRGALPIIKLAHRAVSAIASITMFTAAADTLYYDTQPRVIDFAVQVILIGVLAFSAMRHMAAAPTQSGQDQPLQFQR